MGRLILMICLLFIFLSNLSGNSPHKTKVFSLYSGLTNRDTVPDKQLLYNGRIWRSLYSHIFGDEFLFTKEWLKGEVNINDMTFRNVPLKYDLYNDQLITMINQGMPIQLNKELIKGFILLYENKQHIFENFGTGPGNPIKGIGQVLYKGNICLILKQKKLLNKLAVENKYDEFYQVQSLFILKNGIYYRVSGKKDMLNVLSDKEVQLKNFIREKKIRVRKKNPESFLPAIIFYDNLKK